MSIPNEKTTSSWWSTIPGTITAIATLITAVGGLIIILQTTGVMNKKEDEVKPSAGEESLKPPVTSAIQPAVHLDSKLKITDSYSYDLDEGTIEDLEKSDGIDFFWRRPTSMEYELVPDLGKFVLLGKIDFDQLSLESLQKLEYSKNPINSDLLIKGAVVGIITKANRFGKFLVEEDGPEPKIRLVVYARE